MIREPGALFPARRRDFERYSNREVCTTSRICFHSVHNSLILVEHPSSFGGPLDPTGALV
jgi:hypothetical protein